MYSYKSNDLTRREFLTRSLSGLALAGLPEWFASEAVAAEHERAVDFPRRIGPNDKIQFGAIGVGGQGRGDAHAAHSHPGCQVIAVCDVDASHRDEAAGGFGPDTTRYNDFRELLARKDIDAVTIATPDHWHVLIAIAALRAGKDIYCEKPLTLTIAEGKRLAQVAKETGRVFQVGSQQRSDARFRLACELVRNNRLGKIKRVETHLPSAPAGGPFQVKPVPAGFDWEMWQGQTPRTAYVPERTHWNFRYWYEYAGGMVTDWGAHHNDIAQWGLGTEHTGPTRVRSMGVAPPPCKECFNVHTQFDITYTYPSGTQLLCSSKGENGVQFKGENGWIFVSRGTIRASEDHLLTDPLPADAIKLYVSNDHMGNFVDCVRSRRQTICPAEIGHRSVSVCHIGNISLRLGGRALDWDPERQRFPHDHEAEAMASRPMHKPWHLT